MFLRNAWYVIAEPREVAPGKILSRTVLGQPLAVFRAADGAPAALYDRCCHRQAPLSLGEVIDGGRLRCNYHGLVYEPSGKCVHIPGQTTIPPGAEVQSFPCVERHDWLWVWPGEAEKAEPSLIPDFHWADTPGWTTVGDRLPMRGHYMLLVDNLLDLSHLGYLHRRTIGVPELAERGTIKTARGERSVSVVRQTLDHPVPAGMRDTHKMTGNVDRWSVIEYVPPSSVIIESSIVPTASCQTREDRLKYQVSMILNFITPETEHSLHYFWRHARNYATEDATISKTIYDRLVVTFDEDKSMVEGQQTNLDRDAALGPVQINADSGTVAARRLLRQMIQAEQAGSQAAAE